MTNIINQNDGFYNETFSELDCTDQAFFSKEFEHCTFINCDFSDSKFNNCTFSECHFKNCQLSVLEVTNSKFDEVSFEQCKMLAIDWTRAYWRDLALGSALKFINCNISSSSFYGLKQSKAKFTECKVHDVDFREATLTKASFVGSDLMLSLFSHTNLSGANFDSAVNYNINLNHNNVENAIFSRLEAVSLLESLGIELVD